VSRIVDKSKPLSQEDAQYLSDRGELSEAEQAKYGIKPNPLGGTPSSEAVNTGDVGSSDGNTLVGPSTAPSPEEVAAAAAKAASEAAEPAKAPAKKAAKAAKATAKAKAK
jgi:hypothetical protein